MDEFSPGSKKIHIDIDLSSINKTIMVDLPIIADAGKALDALITAWKDGKHKLDQTALKDWWAQIDTWRDRKCLAYAQETGAAEIRPNMP